MWNSLSLNSHVWIWMNSKLMFQKLFERKKITMFFLKQFKRIFFTENSWTTFIITNDPVEGYSLSARGFFGIFSNKSLMVGETILNTDRWANNCFPPAVIVKSICFPFAYNWAIPLAKVSLRLTHFTLKSGTEFFAVAILHQIFLNNFFRKF